MTDERSEWISKRAYALWEAAGRPWGRSQHHWEQAAAEREIMERTRASVDGQDVLLKLRQNPTIHQADNDTEESGRDEHHQTSRIR